MGDYEIVEWNPVNLSPIALERDLNDLATLLVECVAQGAGVSFMHPLRLADARAFWEGNVLPAVSNRHTRAYFARQGERIVGSVLLHTKLPPNQPHRADVAKMLVLPECRRQGIGRALMRALIKAAKDEGKKLLTLDTNTSSNGKPLYESLGFIAIGEIPRFSLHPTGEYLEGATFMYKEI